MSSLQAKIGNFLRKRRRSAKNASPSSLSPQNQQLTVSNPNVAAIPSSASVLTPLLRPQSTPAPSAPISSLPSAARFSSLWEQALEKLRQKGLSDLDCKGHDVQLVQNLIAETKARKEECDAKRLYYENSRGEKVFYADAFLKQLNKYALIGDIAIQHHPDVVALAWAGFRLLLQVGIAYTDNMGMISDSLEYLVSVIFCCDIYEKLYSGMQLAAAEPLNNSIVDLYASILEYLWCAKQHLEKNTSVRIAESFSSNLKRLWEAIRGLEKVTREKADVVEKEAASKERFDQEARTKDWRILLAEIRKSVQNIERAWEQARRDRRLKVLQWVSDVEFGSHHSEFKRRRHPDSGNWLLVNEKFGDWKVSSSTQIFWLRGDAGSGKTILASKVVDLFKDQLPRTGRCALAYFYCYFQESLRSDPGSVLRAIVKQLCVAYSEEHLPEPLISIYNRREKEAHSTGCLDLIECQYLIIELSKEFSKTMIVIDALDECDLQTRGGLFQVMKEVATSGNCIKIFVTGRNESDIWDMLFDIPSHYIDAKDNSEDIKQYIKTEIERFCNEKPLLKVDQLLKNEIISTLESGAKGMFMWVYLQIQAIRNEHTPGDVRCALQSLPDDLDKTYLNILARIQKQSKNSRHRAKIVLQWILCAVGVCSPRIVSQALLVKPGSIKAILDNDQLMGCPQILGICRNLVVYDENLAVLRFAHFSVKEFLEGQQEFDLAQAHTSMAEICLTVLTNFCDPQSCPVPDLLQYAVLNWAAHVRLSEGGNSNLMQLWKSFLEPSSVYYQQWTLNITRQHRELRGRGTEVIHPLWVACYFQLYNIFVFLLDSDDCVIPNCCNSDGTTPLICAARYGYQNFVKLLIRKNGVDVNCKDENSWTPLLWAASEGHEKVVQLLLGNEGVDVNCKGEDGLTPLSWAARKGHEKVVQLLLGKEGVDVNCKDEDGLTPLSWATIRGHEKVVQLLLGKEGVDVNCKDENGLTPLSWAAREGHEMVVQLLLGKEGVDVNCKDKYDLTPLSWAAREGREKIVQLLLGKEGVDVNCKDKYDLTPLSWAASEGHEKVVQLLLGKEGVDVNCKDEDGLTPLSWAAREGHEMVVQLLLGKEGVDVNCKDENGLTPLSLAVRWGRKKVVQLLLGKEGVDVNCKDATVAGSGEGP